MPLVEAGYERGSEKRERRPSQRPICKAHRSERCAPGAKKQNAQDRVADDMASLAHVEVPILKMFPIEVEKKMQQRVKKPACIVGGEQRAGFNGDDNQPEYRGSPRFQNFVTVGVQSEGCSRGETLSG